MIKVIISTFRESAALPSNCMVYFIFIFSFITSEMNSKLIHIEDSMVGPDDLGCLF